MALTPGDQSHQGEHRTDHEMGQPDPLGEVRVDQSDAPDGEQEEHGEGETGRKQAEHNGLNDLEQRLRCLAPDRVDHLFDRVDRLRNPILIRFRLFLVHGS